MAAPLLLRTIPRHLRLAHRTSSSRFITFSTISSLFKPTDRSSQQDNVTSGVSGGAAESTAFTSVKDTAKFFKWEDSPDYRQWKDRESEILQDIEPIVSRTKEILHSDRYADGERLSVEDEKAVIEKLLAYHPHSEDKIGSGIHSIMVDKHPQFRRSRCLFVVRTDGGWIDFSYQKCLRTYVREKYPTYAERFIREHFKRGSG